MLKLTHPPNICQNSPSFIPSLAHSHRDLITGVQKAWTGLSVTGSKTEEGQVQFGVEERKMNQVAFLKLYF